MMRITKNIEEANAITHGGRFHADEVMATVILSKALGDLCICRTFKVPENLDEDVIVYDIGLGEFDHHQKGGNGARENEIPYASAGLIWRDFGYDIVANTPNPDFIWNMVDSNLIQPIDANDNGTMPKVDYPTQPYSISNAISSFNPNWDSCESSDEAFLEAVAFAEIVFDNFLSSTISKARAEQIVEDAIEASKDHIMVLDKFVPWQSFIFSSRNEKAEDILFIVFPSSRGGYNWQCIPDAPGSFGHRKPVPSEWKGLNDAELQDVTGVATATFCHPAGFIGGALTLEDAIKVAKLAVEA